MTELEKALKDIDTTPHPNGLRDGIIYYNEEGDFCVYITTIPLVSGLSIWQCIMVG